MEITHQQKIERLEAERRQLEDRIRRLKRAAQTAERKKLTRAKIILGALILRDYQPLLRQLITQASPRTPSFCAPCFLRLRRKRHVGRLEPVSGHPCASDFRATGAFRRKAKLDFAKMHINRVEQAYKRDPSDFVHLHLSADPR
jgi:hypothetical protein